MEKFHSKKFIYRFLVIGLLAVTLICLCLSKYEMRIKKFSTEGIPVLTEADGARVTVENVGRIPDRYRGKYMVQVGGFAYIKGQPTDSVAIHVLLQDESTGDVYLFPTAMKELEGLTELAGDGVDYTNSGFSTGVYTNNKVFTTHRLRVLLLYTLVDKTYLMETDTYLE